MITRALVSGANGFIGSNVCRVLRAAGVPVRALVLPQESTSELEALGVEAAWRVLPLAGAPPLTRYRISLFRGDLVFSAEKARVAFGYQPAIGLGEGLRRTRAWLEQHGTPPV